MARYAPFRTGDLFELRSNPQLNKESFTFAEKGYPYFTRTSFNNGVLGYVEYLDEEHKIKGNSLAIGMIEMRFHYMESDFYAGQFTKTAFPKFDGFNKYLALYFISVFGKYQSIFQGVLVRDFEKTFYYTYIHLPITKEGKVDFAYMEKYIRKMETDRMEKLEEHLKQNKLANCKLSHAEKQFLMAYHENTKEHKLFSIGGLFYKKDMPHGDSRAFRVKERDDLHNIAGVVAKYDDNGVMYWVKEGDFDFSIDEDGITVIANGAVASGRVFYQEHKYTILNDAYTIKMKHREKIGREVGLYLVATIEKRLFSKYSWENKPTWEKIKNEEIELPVDSDGNPDFNYMASFIRIQQKIAIRSLVDWRQVG